MTHVFDRWNSISLRTKITGVTVLVLTFGLLVAGLGTMLLFRPVLISLFDQQLESIAAQPKGINAILPGQTTSEGGPILGQGSTASFYVILYGPDGTPMAQNWPSVPDEKKPAVPGTMSLEQGAACANQGAGWLQSVDGTVSFRSICAVVQLQGNTPTYGTAIIAISTTPLDNTLAAYLSIFFSFGVIVVIIGAFLTRALVTTTFRPLREVERTASEIADGDFSQRLGGATPNTEVGRLNRSLNTMLNRIDQAFKDRARTIDQMRRFVGDASHELRTPLVSVRGYAELYRMGALQSPEEVAQAMERIEKEAVRMGLLVEDLLELARLDETKPLAVAVVDLVPLAHDAALDANAGNPDRTVSVVLSLPPLPPPPPGPSALEPPADGTLDEADDQASMTKSAGPRTRVTNSTGPIGFAGATLARLRRRPRRPEPGLETVPLELGDIPEPPRMRALVMAEENKLRQVIANLIGNAVRYTPQGSPIEIGVAVEPDREVAVLSVIDHGEGIPPQIREKIFQRFWRADTSRARETGGSGLGLAIVHSIVDAHHGTVDVVETPGGGATFRVTLPLVDSPHAPKAPEEA
ncbi:sensor histidine kinase [Humibacter ginsenosidimutans]|uniref:histidine kinase n=1 Tax=Humibacter ginsenosidimutans TaxID=2599293 RepID=A0A5B8M323_9MICO|nr:HAMP domain-containing sensor histidine kinase [Humibacter ginsenosidimutans]QDZ14743.1 HAMP domain-containing histidine kinase [Humibacter ginsenosidimutans]